MRTTLILLLALSLASCGTFRRAVNKEVAAIEIEAVSTAEEVVIVTEKIDTVITIRPDTLAVTVDLDVDTPFMFEDERQTLTITYDRPTNSVRTVATIKPASVPVTLERETVAKRSSRLELDLSTETETKTVDVKRTSPLIPGWLWLWIILLAIVAVYYKWYKVAS